MLIVAKQKNAHICLNVRQVYKGEIEEKLLSRSLQPLNEAIMNTYEKTVKHYFHFNCLNYVNRK